MSVTRQSPAGSCVLAEVEALVSVSRARITVISGAFDAAGMEGVAWMRVPLPAGPVLVCYIVFQAFARLAHARWRRRHHAEFRLTQATEGQLPGAEVVYAHYCHRAYLRGAWHHSEVRGLRRLLRRLNHEFNACTEARAFRQARAIVTPSSGLRREIMKTYPALQAPVIVLPNPIDLSSFERPVGYDHPAQRRALGLAADACVFVFVALGDFARKGLGVILEGLARIREEDRNGMRLFVVGGGPSEIREFERRAARLGLAGAVTFAGRQDDVRPFLWASNALVLASLYETFSLVAFQAAAAGLLPIVTPGLYGVEDFVIDGETGWVVDREPEAFARALARTSRESGAVRAIALRAQERAREYSHERFAERWRGLWKSLVEDRTSA
ncbi:MAG: glycosyltransferase family 4 protein [Opitutaceae bacterium]